MEKFRKKWRNLCARLGAKKAVDVTFDLLIVLYTDPYREYHNDGHLGVCFHEFDKVRENLENPDEAEMALFMHDAFYNTRSDSNEKNSAIFSAIQHEHMGISLDSRQIIYELIMDTQHNKKPRTSDGMTICDIDLSIMGYPWKIYKEVGERIKKEYAWVPEEEGKKWRIAVLNGFLERKRIFYNNYFYAKYEAQARKNLKRAIAELK